MNGQVCFYTDQVKEKLYMEVEKFESQLKRNKTKAGNISLLGDCLPSTYKPLGSLSGSESQA